MAFPKPTSTPLDGIQLPGLPPGFTVSTDRVDSESRKLIRAVQSGTNWPLQSSRAPFGRRTTSNRRTLRTHTHTRGAPGRYSPCLEPNSWTMMDGFERAPCLISDLEELDLGQEARERMISGGEGGQWKVKERAGASEQKRERQGGVRKIERERERERGRGDGSAEGPKLAALCLHSLLPSTLTCSQHPHMLLALSSQTWTGGWRIDGRSISEASLSYEHQHEIRVIGISFGRVKFALHGLSSCSQPSG